MRTIPLSRPLKFVPYFRLPYRQTILSKSYIEILLPKSSIAGADFIPYLAYIALVWGLLSIAKNCSGLFPCFGNIRHFSIHSFFM